MPESQCSRSADSYRVQEKRKPAEYVKISKNGDKMEVCADCRKMPDMYENKTIRAQETSKIDLPKSPIWGIIEINLTGI